jgi:pyridoxal/pyridoxine/pyridoxamine kinase
MSENQRELIKQYLNSLVNQFIANPKHRDIDIVFTGYLGESLHGDTLGNTHRDHK